MTDTYAKQEEGDEEEDVEVEGRQRQRREVGQGQGGEEGQGRGRRDGFQDALSKVHQLESEKEAITTIEFVYGRNPNLFKCWIPLLGILFVIITFLSLLFLVTLPELRAVQRQRETTCLILEFRSATIYQGSETCPPLLPLPLPLTLPSLQATINRQDKLVLSEVLLVRYNVLSADDPSSSSSSSERHKYMQRDGVFRFSFPSPSFAFSLYLLFLFSEHLRFHSLLNTFKNEDDSSSSSLTAIITTPSCSFPRKMCNSDFIEDCTSPFLSQQLMSYCFSSKYNSAQNVTCYYEQVREEGRKGFSLFLFVFVDPAILLSFSSLFPLPPLFYYPLPFLLSLCLHHLFSPPTKGFTRGGLFPGKQKAFHSTLAPYFDRSLHSSVPSSFF
jgi:hypothetical protein